MNEDVREAAAAWFGEGQAFALAVVIAASGSSPLPVGSAMAVGPAGEAVGGVSGGCVDGTVYQSALEVRDSAVPRIETFEYSDEEAFAVALPCGGAITVAIEAVGGGDSPRFQAALQRLESHDTAKLLVFGATKHAAALARFAKQLGFRVVVCDPRPVFTTRERFPDADEVVCAWPDRYLASAAVDSATAICVLAHDERFDVPLLLAALRTDAGYIGAMGSRRACQEREGRLIAAGADDGQLARLRAPIGLDLGGRTPAETALSILAEIVMVKAGRTGAPLRSLRTPVHGR